MKDFRFGTIHVTGTRHPVGDHRSQVILYFEGFRLEPPSGVDALYSLEKYFSCLSLSFSLVFLYRSLEAYDLVFLRSKNMSSGCRDLLVLPLFFLELKVELRIMAHSAMAHSPTWETQTNSPKRCQEALRVFSYDRQLPQFPYASSPLKDADFKENRLECFTEDANLLAICCNRLA